MTTQIQYDFVLDCSITMTWLFEDEVTKDSDEILEKLNNSRAIVPTIWALEVANVLLVACRKKRITMQQASSFVDALKTLPIHTDDSTTKRAMHSIFLVATNYNLTIYDAAYLELAMREKIPLATQDSDLVKAAKQLQIPIL